MHVPVYEEEVGWEFFNKSNIKVSPLSPKKELKELFKCILESHIMLKLKKETILEWISLISYDKGIMALGFLS